MKSDLLLLFCLRFWKPGHLAGTCTQLLSLDELISFNSLQVGSSNQANKRQEGNSNLDCVPRTAVVAMSDERGKRGGGP